MSIIGRCFNLDEFLWPKRFVPIGSHIGYFKIYSATLICLLLQPQFFSGFFLSTFSEE